MTGQALTSYLQLLPSLLPEMAVDWPINFAEVNVTTVTVFGLAADQTSFNTSWSFEYDPVGAAGDEIRAMFVGPLRYMADIDGGPNLILESSNFATLMLAEFDVADLPNLPGWWPQCRFLLYDQLDWALVRTAITALVHNLSPIVRQQLEVEQPALVGAADDQVARWFLGELQNGQPVDFALPVIPGDVLGGGEVTNAGQHRARIRAKENLDDPFFLNLGFYAYVFVQLAFLDGSAVPEANLRATLLSHDLPLVASGGIKRISAAPGLGAFSTVQAAVLAAAPGDVVLIADAGPYQAPSVIDIDKPLSILGVPGDALATPTPALSVVHGNRPPDGQRTTAAWVSAAHGVFRILNVSTGMVTVANLRIENGSDRQGGGIFVNEVHRVWIHNCIFTDNVAYAGGWLFEGFGGAICTRHAGILIDKCLFSNNEANSRGGAMGIFGYGWPVVQQCRFENNRAVFLNIINPATLRPFLTRPDGGALAMQMATPNAEERFGRIGAIAHAFDGLTMVDAMIHANQMHNDGLLTADDLALFKDLGLGNIDDYWDAVKLDASHESQVLIRGNTFAGNIADDDGGAIYATGLVRGRCENNTIMANAAGANGGGIRISTACDFVIEGGQILGNQSNRHMTGYRCERDREDGEWKFDWITFAGGGIASRTSNLRLVDVLITGNIANRFAGGGVFLTSTDDGALPISVVGMGTDWNKIRNLLVRDPATGATRERFAAFTLEVEHCTITANCCGWCAGGVSRPAPQNPAGRCSSPPTDSDARDAQHAKGGGIYALRFAEDPSDSDSFFPPLVIRIGAGTTLTGNTAAFSPTASELFIADLTRPAPNNPVVDTVGLLRDSAGTLLNPFVYGGTSS